jgi:crotonobetainyl-CoA:carnitine CoA-transferase CaiB-like acyl-CoA transferase
VPCGPINDLAQAFELASALGLEPVVEVDGTPTVAHPITLSQTPATYRSGPPDLPSD